MIFTFTQIQNLIQVLDKSRLMFIVKQLGSGYLSNVDKAVLKAAGVDLSKFTNSKGVLEHAFLFGILAEAIGDERAKKMSYKEFQQFLASGNFIPLNEEEEFALQQVKNRAYTDISNLGNRMKNTVSNAMLKRNQSRSTMVADVIKKKTANAIQLRTGARALAADLANTTKDWEVDWLRIAYYLTHEAYNSGRAQSILRNYGKDAEVYFDVYEGACDSCRILYLEHPSEPESKPKVFKLEDVIKNGNNIGVPKKQWKPTISPTHPYCRCTINYKDPNMGWDEETRSFTKPIKKQSANPKLQGFDPTKFFTIKKT
jgi:hypothetical protein